MFKFLVQPALATFIALFLLACASNPSKQVSPARSSQTELADRQFSELYARLKQNIEAVDYNTLWEAYLQTSQPTNTQQKFEAFQQLKNQLESGSLSCDKIDWDSIILQNAWSLQPHLAAADCYRQINRPKMAAFHENFVEMLIAGILSSGDGAHYYSAWEAASWGDVEDILKIAGYQVVDRYLELHAARQGFYYLVIANDNEGKQHKLYFDTQRFVSAALGYKGYFFVDDLPLGEKLAVSLGASDPVSAIAVGDMLLADNEKKLASEWYLKASLYENGAAYLRLADMCLLNQAADFSEATCLEFLTKTAEIGNAYAFVYLSGLYEQGIWVNKDQQLAKDFMALAGEKLGPGESLAFLADLYASNRFGQLSEKSINALYEKAWLAGKASPNWVERLAEAAKTNQQAFLRLTDLAKQGVVNAQFHIGMQRLKTDKERNPLLPFNDQQLLDMIKASADSGLPASNFLLGLMYRFGVGVARDQDKALEHFRTAAKDWHPKAQVMVARLSPIQEISQIEKSQQTAVNLLNQIQRIFRDSFYLMISAANQGDTEAMVFTGNFYRDGIGTTKDLQRAKLYYQIAAEQDNSDGQYELARLLLAGRPDKAQIGQALEWLNKATDSNNAKAIYYLSKLYRNGQYLEKNKQKAFELTKASAELGYSVAQVTLGEMLEQGYVGPGNKKAAIDWYQKAAKKGNKDAKKNLMRLGIST